MLAKHSMLFASLTTAQKAVVANPEQTLDIHRPSNTPVTDRVKFSSPAGSLGNQYLALVKHKDARATNIWQRPPHELFYSCILKSTS